MKKKPFKIYAVVEYEFDLDIPEEECKNYESLIDYALNNDPTDLVCKAETTANTWQGFNCAYLKGIQDLTTMVCYDLEDG